MTLQTQDALSALLDALGFEAMAKEVLSENDTERLGLYARVIIKNTPTHTDKQYLAASFRKLGLTWKETT